MTFQFSRRKLQRSKDLEPASPANEPINQLTNEPWTMNYEQCTTKYEIRFTIYASREWDTIYERLRTKLSNLFMQNKPNLQKSQMNVNTYSTTEYKNKSNRTIGENKPNQTQSPKGQNELNIGC